MTPNFGKTTFNDQELAQLRGEATAYIDRHGLTKKKFAEDCDVPEGTFGPWLAGSYAGDNEKQAAKVYRFLNARKEQAAMAASVPTAPQWQETKTGLSVMAALDHAQVFNDLVVVGLGPGLGKSATIKQYQATRPRVWVATMAPSSRGVPNALIELLAAMGEDEAKGTPQALSRRVQRKAAMGGLIVIDEAQHLSQQAVDEMRSIHDRTGVGMVFSGDESVFNLFDGTRRQAFAQFHSRIGLRLRQSRPHAEDVKVLARAHGLTDLPSLKLAHEIAMKPGALRGLTKTLLQARRMSNMLDVPMTPSLIREAWAQRAPDLAAA